MLSERSQSQKDKRCAMQAVQFTETERWRMQGLGRCCLVGTEFQFCRMTSVLEVVGADGVTARELYLVPLNCTLKTGEKSKR